ncbi:MAG: hypothetical protein LBH40_00710 [Alphaproteobacteria bacterium]|jgi:hypothetical protein|nr:hypothetical protein [Alphaproteobacteria bacterium]
MKKLLLIIALVLLSFNTYAIEIDNVIGVSGYYGSYKSTMSHTQNATIKNPDPSKPNISEFFVDSTKVSNNGYTLGLEYQARFDKMFALGFGFQNNKINNISFNEDSESYIYNSNNIYAVATISPYKNKYISVSLGVQLGVDLNKFDNQNSTNVTFSPLADLEINLSNKIMLFSRFLYYPNDRGSFTKNVDYNTNILSKYDVVELGDLNSINVVPNANNYDLKIGIRYKI